MATTLVWAGDLWAQSPDEDALLRECYALRQQGDHRASLERCQRAVALHRHGRTVAQLAITEFALEQWALAATHLREALADTTHPWVQQNRALLEETLARTRPRVAELRVETNERDATLTVNGEARGTLPLATPLYLLPGAARIEVRGPGGQHIERELPLAAGETRRESVQFVATTSQRTQGAASPGDPRRTLLPTPARPLDGASTRRVLAWTAGGIAIVGIGLGVVAWRLREDAVSGYVTACPTQAVSGATELDRCTRLHGQAEGDVNQWQAVSIAGLVAGGVFGVGAAVLFATLPASGGQERSAWQCGGGPGDIGVGCQVSF